MARMHPKKYSIADFTYSLPDEKIAAFPLEQRDASKLLIYKNDKIQESTYKHIADYLPANSLLIFNNTKVIQARILFQKSTGGGIEIFCLEPYEAINEYTIVMSKTESVQWKCMIGGVSKWKDGLLEKEVVINKEQLIIKAELIEKLSDAYIIKFSWYPTRYSFSEILQFVGEIPLPPYIKRKAETTDKERYQTIYATHDGSVAAPTAGLHFTDDIFSSLAKKNISKDYVTLHVGAGTFKPVKATIMEGHEMHAEWIDVNISTIDNILANLDNTIVATGTTSLRTIESLYWLGVKTMINPDIDYDRLIIEQWEVYEDKLAATRYSAVEALTALIQWMKKNDHEKLVTKTQILIAPGYTFKIIKALITNFHQPQSTLLLLVAAAIGDNWKIVYQYAMENDFRFLSYGDGSLLYIKE
ncbi:MAG TPA: S-adenosylmethionine:tRNA ribosyltransferase-isomerase [Ferruginibacter sp.]|jgi:S-adenosylmethionine:tRNA ribosyltransferase-isomerase|nr:S-adenosylmethionine:tRNA ribosyltransferase-isomerase [Ferruginibacter sp.]